MRAEGPSPRLRGKLIRPPEPVLADGSIPAPAGETTPGRWRLSSRRVHPRACGGNLTERVSVHRVPGPSPRLRGKHRPRNPGIAGKGSIPAPAGETQQPGPPPPRTSVHPRACGGNPPVTARDMMPAGPSPRLRGKPAQWVAIVGAGRSIPAPAGETLPTLCRVESATVHPRACGGDGAPLCAVTLDAGPSPRLRGKLGRRWSRSAKPGSIPAPAGET